MNKITLNNTVLRAPVLLVLCLYFLFPNNVAFANAGWIIGGGNPQLMNEEHKTIRMQNETVDVHVGKYLIKVDCKFNFRNDGPACKVKMGFPDIAFDAGERSYPFFFSFNSYKNGVEVPTKVERGDDKYDEFFWHTHEVDFPANSNLEIRDVYTVPPCLSVDYGKNFSKVFFYFLHTGASWNGKIQNAQINVSFDRDVVRSPLKAVDQSRLSPKDRPGNLVVYESSVKPVIDGDRLRFNLADFEPGEDDTLALEFGSLNEAQTEAYFKKIIEMFIENSRSALSQEDLSHLNNYLRKVGKKSTAEMTQPLQAKSSVKKR